MDNSIPATVLEYELTVEDWLGSHQRAMDKAVESKNSVVDSHRMIKLAWSTLFVVSLAAYIVVMWAVRNQVAWAAIAVLAVYVILIAIGRLTGSPLKVAARRAMEESLRQGKIPVPLGPTRLWLDEDGVHTANEWGSSTHLWRSVREINDLGDVYQLLFQYDIHTSLPKRAFESEESMRNFIEAIRSRAAPPTRRTGPGAA